MAERKKKAARALIFNSEPAKNGVEMIGSDRKIQGKIISKELKFFDTVTSVFHDFTEVEKKSIKVSSTNEQRFDIKVNNQRTNPAARVLVYEDCEDDEDANENGRATPPNIQERCASTPGAPIKSRKEFDKKVLRPKKLVYYSDRENEENYYLVTPKKSVQNQDKYTRGKLIDVAVMPRKILNIPTDEANLSTVTRQSFAAGIGQGYRKKNRNKAGNVLKNDLTYDKENKADLAAENDQETRKDLCWSYSSKNYDRNGTCQGNREELTNPSKPGEFTHFRI